jgi:hypothetical protein
MRKKKNLIIGDKKLSVASIYMTSKNKPNEAKRNKHKQVLKSKSELKNNQFGQAPPFYPQGPVFGSNNSFSLLSNSQITPNFSQLLNQSNM